MSGWRNLRGWRTFCLYGMSRGKLLFRRIIAGRGVQSRKLCDRIGQRLFELWAWYVPVVSIPIVVRKLRDRDLPRKYGLFDEHQLCCGAISIRYGPSVLRELSVRSIPIAGRSNNLFWLSVRDILFVYRPIDALGVSRG